MKDFIFGLGNIYPFKNKTRLREKEKQRDCIHRNESCMCCDRKTTLVKKLKFFSKNKQWSNWHLFPCETLLWRSVKILILLVDASIEILQIFPGMLPLSPFCNLKTSTKLVSLPKDNAPPGWNTSLWTVDKNVSSYYVWSQMCLSRQPLCCAIVMYMISLSVTCRRPFTNSNYKGLWDWVFGMHCFWSE